MAMNYYVYILGTQGFLDNCKSHLNHVDLVFSLTNNVEMFKTEVSNIREPERSFVVVEDKKVSSYNRKHMFIGTKTVTYEWLREISTRLNANTFSFEITKYKEIEYKILNLIKRAQEEALINAKKNQPALIVEDIPENLIADNEMISEPLQEEVGGINISEIIKQAEVVASNDFDEDAISAAIETAATNQKKQFSSKKIEDMNSPGDMSDTDIMSASDIEKLMQQERPMEDTATQTDGNMAQKLLSTYDEEEMYKMVNKGEPLS